MSSYLRKRVRGLLKTTFSNASSSDSPDIVEEKPLPTHPLDPSGLLYDRILNGKNGRKVEIPETYSGKTGLDLPVIHLAEFKTTVKSCFTGPDGGLTQVGRVMQNPICRMANLDDELSLSSYDGADDDDEDASGTLKRNGNNNGTNLVPSKSLEALGFHPSDLAPSCSTDTYDWTSAHTLRSFGASTSLYERHPLTGAHAGTPVADVFAIVSRENNAILALADGVNWGEGARLAARCAVRGAIDHLNNAIEKSAFETTTDIFHSMLGAFHAGHSLILQEGGALTTLCVAIVAPMRDSNEYALCVCNVGDSLCFVYNAAYGVREVTLASHDIGLNRDMRDAGGALGPVDGRNPQLHNLTCSMTFIQEGDLVFITSDGISDNFDPVVGKFCVIKHTDSEKENLMDIEADHPAAVAKASQVFQKIESIPKRQRCNATVPSVDALERHELMLLRMADVIANGVNLRLPEAPINGENSPYAIPTTPESGIDGTPTSELASPRVPRKNSTTASEVCRNLITFATQLSSAKRRTLENPELYRTRTHSRTEERVRRKMVRNMIMEMPGKLDHASCVAYKVGEWEDEPATVRQVEPNTVPSPVVNGTVESTSTVNVTTLFCRPSEFHSTGLTLIAEESEHVKKSIETEPQQPPELPPPTPTPRSIDGTRSPYEELPETVNEMSSPTRVGRVNAITNKKPKKHHGRGSAARHTLGVDVAWLKRLVTSRTTSPADSDTLAPMHPPLAAHSSQMNSQASMAETPTTPMSPPTGSRRHRPSYAPPEVPRPFSFRKFFVKPPKPPPATLPASTPLRSPNKI
uniref:PPM-type phosphatase domain-containing protein n=1 Tax=Panagrellus redivivus TaxID=6233 RepID=A0A7E4ULJ7_PANRE